MVKTLFWSILKLAEAGRYQAGLPVMAMHYVRLPVQYFVVYRELGHGAGKYGKTLSIVVPVVAVRMHVGVARAVKQAGNIHQQQGHSQVLFRGFQDAHIMRLLYARYFQPARHPDLGHFSSTTR